MALRHRSRRKPTPVFRPASPCPETLRIVSVPPEKPSCTPTRQEAPPSRPPSMNSSENTPSPQLNTDQSDRSTDQMDLQGGFPRMDTALRNASLLLEDRIDPRRC